MSLIPYILLKGGETMGKIILKENNFDISCDIPFCTNRANWTVMGKGPLNMGFNLCPECAKGLFEEFKKVFNTKIDKSIEKVDPKKPKKPKKEEIE